MTANDGFPFVPRGLSRTQAALYVGVGPTKFDELVRDGKMPPAKRVGARLLWDRHALDASFEDLGESGNVLQDMIDAARARKEQSPSTKPRR
jgi:hypothetical protein